MRPHPIALSSILPAVQRARIPILTIVLTYIISVVIGIIMVNANVPFAVNTRDSLIQNANTNDSAAIALNNGHRLQAGLIDFGGNLFLGAVPSTVTGFGIIFAYPLVVYRGWIGGIVSIDDAHQSRLAQPSEAIYYLVTLILQLIPYSLAGGAGVHLGLAYYRSYSDASIPKWIGVPKAAVLDVIHIYLLVIPLFLIASLWEFLVV